MDIKKSFHIKGGCVNSGQLPESKLATKTDGYIRKNIIRPFSTHYNPDTKTRVSEFKEINTKLTNNDNYNIPLDVLEEFANSLPEKVFEQQNQVPVIPALVEDVSWIQNIIYHYYFYLYYYYFVFYKYLKDNS